MMSENSSYVSADFRELKGILTVTEEGLNNLFQELNQPLEEGRGRIYATSTVSLMQFNSSSHHSINIMEVDEGEVAHPPN